MAKRNARTKLTEKEFQAQVIRLAKLYSWIVYHTHDSRRSAHGYPDLTMLHPGRRQLIVAELKVGKNTTTAAQEEWLTAFTAVGIDAYVWTPDEWGEIERVLKGE